MPGFILHQNAVVTCSHAGKAIPTAVAPRVLVMTQPAAVFGAPWQVAGCAFPPPPAANGPCVSALFVTSATRVFSFAQPLLLQDSQANCLPTGTPLIIAVTQTRVFAM